MDSHILTCKAAKASGAMPTGQSSRLRSRLEDSRRGSATAASGRLISQQAGASQSSSSRAGATCQPCGPYSNTRDIMAAASSPPEFAATGGDGALVPCRICGRTFTIDRVAKHQAICQKTSRSRRPVFHSERQRVYTEGGSNGNAIGEGMPSYSRPGRPTVPTKSKGVGSSKQLPRAMKTDWREQS